MLQRIINAAEDYKCCRGLEILQGIINTAEDYKYCRGL